LRDDCGLRAQHLRNHPWCSQVLGRKQWWSPVCEHARDRSARSRVQRGSSRAHKPRCERPGAVNRFSILSFMRTPRWRSQVLGFQPQQPAQYRHHRFRCLNTDTDPRSRIWRSGYSHRWRTFMRAPKRPSPMLG